MSELEGLGGVSINRIYLFGEVYAGTTKSETGSRDPEERARAISRILRKISMLRSIVDEKNIKKIFVEEGSVSKKPVILNFPDIDVKVLQVDPLVQRTIEVTSREIGDSIAMKEKLLSEFAGVPEGSLKSKGSDEDPAEPDRYAYVLQERMKGLESADELFHKLDEVTANLEAGWVDEIHNEFIDPSLLLCGKGHIYPSKEDVMAFGKSGRIPELLRERGYDVEVVFVEGEE